MSMMIKITAVLLFGLALSSIAIGKEAKNLPAIELAALMASYPVIILGERHRRPESPQLIADLVNEFTGADSCLAVALEISSDQQSTLDATMARNAPVADISIHPIVDHPAFREMLRDLRDLIQAGRCLSVWAVDIPPAVPVKRDQWMADKIEELAKDHRVLALMGNLHTMKQTRWEGGIDDPFLAERLEQRCLQVLSVMQAWDEGCEEWTGRWLAIDHPRAETAVRRIMSLAAVHHPKTLEAVADGVVIWECGQQ